MTRLNHVAPRTTRTGRDRSRGAAHGPAREARTRRSFDGVVASYIRELAVSSGTTPRAGDTMPGALAGRELSGC
jgi:hypothetical protein